MDQCRMKRPHTDKYRAITDVSPRATKSKSLMDGQWKNGEEKVHCEKPMGQREQLLMNSAENSRGQTGMEVAGDISQDKAKTELDQDSVDNMIGALYRLVPELSSHFIILNKIGEGAFSTVFRAQLTHYPELTETFALKVVIPTTHPSRVENELRCLLRIGGEDNVMGVKLCMRHRDHVVIVMPHFSHDKLQDYLHQMTVQEAREYMRNLLIALRRVHRFSVIHRDIKPSNFLYNRKTKTFALVDFGLASGKMLRKPDDEKCYDYDSLETPAGSGAFTTHRKASPRLNPTSTSSAATPLTPRIPLSPSKKGGLNSNIMLPPPAVSRQRNLEMGASSKHMTLSRKMFARNVSSASMFDRASMGLCDCFGRPVICHLCVARKNQQAPRAGTAGFRPPEVLMKCPDQDTGVDVWAAGVIFMSMLSARYPFFRAPDDMGYLAQIISVLGTDACVKAAKSFDKQLTLSEYIPAADLKVTCMRLRGTQMASKGGQHFDEVTESWAPITDAPFDLLAKMLDPNPKTRISAENALKHSWFSEAEGS